MGLDPRTLGSHPELKADVQWLNHPSAPVSPLIFPHYSSCVRVLTPKASFLLNHLFKVLNLQIQLHSEVLGVGLSTCEF